MGTFEEMRRAPRLASAFWVQVEGVDENPILRRGNISSTGILFEGLMDSEEGALELLHIASQDHSFLVTTMARAVRVVRLDPDDTESRRAVAFIFLPDSPEKRERIEIMVRHMFIEAAEEGDAQLDEHVEMKLERPDPDEVRQAKLQRLNVTRMELETTWPVSLAEKVQVVFRSQKEGSVPFEGYVSEVEASKIKGRYTVSVEMMAAGLRDIKHPRRSITESIDLILADVLLGDDYDFDEDNTVPEQQLLTGFLDRIALPSLLTWFEMENMTGELVLDHNRQRVTLFLHRGAILDIEPNGNDAMTSIRALLGWRSGRFEFYEKPIEREDKVGLSTTGLLLDHFRQVDEAARDV